MQGNSIAERGYFGTMDTTRTARRSEYEVVAQITRELRDTAKASKKDFPAFAEALHRNRKLWQMFAIDVSHEDNALPDELRARIIYLSEFTKEHTKKVLKREASVLPLLEVNMAVLRGLKPGGGTS